MTKMNPLFIDSTKHSGDSVGTQIELNRLLLRDDEKVFCLLKDSVGQSVKLPLKPTGEVFCGKVWLNHREDFEYRFLVENLNGPKFESTQKTGKASYALLVEWDPIRVELVQEEKILEKPVVEIDEKIPEPEAPAFEKPLLREKVGGLISKWGL